VVPVPTEVKWNDFKVH